LIRIIAVVLVVAAGVAGLLLVFSARDEGQIEASPTSGPGELQADLGAAHDGPAEAGGLPTSGTHQPELVTRDRRPLTNDQLIHALELGNVVILYEDRRPPAELVRLQEEVTGPFDAEVAAAGQSIILARHPGPTTALAWRRALESDDPERLSDFADAWLGEGVPR
jgi:Protein of unknown function (DUF3105)